MTIHQTIRTRRRLLGLTQEEVAEYLGVTAPAVNKWEKGSTCPDIALLPPLTRLLQTDLNTLFGFYAEISEPERVRFCREVRETVTTDGLDAGFALAREKLQLFPNSDRLLHDLALLLQGLLLTETDTDKAQAHLAQIDAWYERLAESDEPVIRNSACYMLASRALSAGRYDAAQDYLDRLPDRNDTPDKRMLQAGLLLAQDRADDAAQLLQQTLLGTVSDLQMILLRLLDAELAENGRQAAAYVAARVTRLAEAFDLSPYSAVIGPFLLAQADGEPADVVPLLRQMLEALNVEWCPAASPLYRRVPAVGSGASAAGMTQMLLHELERDEKYRALRKNDDFQALLAEYQA